MDVPMFLIGCVVGGILGILLFILILTLCGGDESEEDSGHDHEYHPYPADFDGMAHLYCTCGDVVRLHPRDVNYEGAR